MTEGQAVTPARGAVGLVNKAPHPNAAKVFINWLLSREGQTTFQRTSVEAETSFQNSRRMDIPKDVLSRDRHRVKGVNYMDLALPKYLDRRPLFKLVTETLARTKKK